jgi:hypothetical protein
MDMPKDAIATSRTQGGGLPETPDNREIIYAHDPAATPLTAIRNVLLQASLTGLKAGGHYERYASLMAPEMLEKLLSSLAPGWITVEDALAHYAACDKLALTDEQFAAMGARVGDRVQETVLVSPAKKQKHAPFELSKAIGPLQRVWPRLFQGGSVQSSKAGPKELVLEEWGFRLNVYDYYRKAHIAALRSTYSALGARISQTKILSYDAARDEMVVSIRWL